MSEAATLPPRPRPLLRRAPITLTTLAFVILVLAFVLATRDSAPVLEFKSHYFVSTLDFSPDGKLLASGSADGKIKIWDAETGALARSIAADTAGVDSVSFSADGSLIASGGRDGIKIWDARTGQQTQKLESATMGADVVRFSPDGRLVASVGPENSVRLWDPDRGTVSKTFEGHKRYVRVLAFSSDGRLLASGDDDGVIKIWTVADGTPLSTIQIPREPNSSGTTIFSVSFAPDSKILASATTNRTVQVWDVETGRLDQSFEVATRPSQLAFAPHMRLLATAGRRGQIFDLSSGSAALRQRFTAYPIAFSPDGRRMAGGDNEGFLIKIWAVD